jgi:hypothetical protein
MWRWLCHVGFVACFATLYLAAFEGVLVLSVPVMVRGALDGGAPGASPSVRSLYMVLPPRD